MMSVKYLHASYCSSCKIARLAYIESSWSGKTSKHFILSREPPPSALQTVKRVLDKQNSWMVIAETCWDT